jgi:hypothetical protein
MSAKSTARPAWRPLLLAVVSAALVGAGISGFGFFRQAFLFELNHFGKRTKAQAKLI